MIDPVDEQIKLLSKQLKVPTFASYNTTLRQAGQDATFNQLLLSLMKRVRGKLILQPLGKEFFLSR